MRRKRPGGQLKSHPGCHVQFAHISPQMTPKSGLCVGIEFTSFQDSWGLFWSIGKMISPAISLLLPLSLTFLQLSFPAKPDGVAKVSPPGLVYKTPRVQLLHVSHIGLA